MREALRGRNLAHVGCMLGLVLGLSGGIALAWVLILHSVAAAIALALWAILTVALGGLGFYLGDAVSDKPTLPTDAP